MKKNSLTTAVIAGIAGVAGFASLANAVDLNPDGLGQVLLYPYYTVEKGQQTYLSVVNTTSTGKAVKVRFLEGYNSREVLDFNLWLSRYDVWTATIFALDDVFDDQGEGAAILTRDKSCTSPMFSEGDGTVGGAPFTKFRSFAYANDGGPQGIARTREGHFEIIEMATLTGSTNSAITHNNGNTPGGCGTVRNLNAANGDMSAPSGGLFGGGAVANVGQGTYFSFNADALDGWSAATRFTGTDNVRPALDEAVDPSGDSATAFVALGSYVATSVYSTQNAIDAVSATLTADAIYNEYVVSPAIGANSDWVVTFPTKRFYVDPLMATATTPIAPFVQRFTSPGVSCVVVGISIYDREEVTTTAGSSGWSPPPPGAPPSSLCRETNVISFLDVTTAPTESGVLGSKLVTNIRPTVGTEGWVKLNLNPASEPHALRASLNGNVFHGLPVTGFWANNLVNENVSDGVMSNYSGVYRHRASRTCTAGDSTCS